MVYTDRMRGGISKIVAGILALIITGSAGYFFAVSSYPERVREVIVCMCFNAWDPCKTEKMKIAPGWMRRGLPPRWIWIDSENGFNFCAPPGTRYTRLKGIDWEAGEFDGPDFHFRFYLGRYPQDPHDLKHEADYSQQQLTVDGRSAFFQQMTFGGDDTRDAPYFAELFVRKAIVADVQSKDWLALDLYGRAKTPVARETMKKVFMTMRFDDP